ncbi:hypothetical protein GUJ93_ZPchr0013g34411 [Zizania palustris]|uniref:ENT domain-containing protein n=1 Tax=Zizania palustris TaxID=103762 RepID=A0A8J5WWK3_ZIZPA|nr:hypothetical protein GUJ93_ZPchr0013g34411 [Zizania palustris]
MAAAARPLVSVKALEGDMATDSVGVQMPEVLRAPIRPDVVTFTHRLLSCNRRQPYAVSRRAGHQTSAESWGTGRAVSHSIESIEKTAQSIKVLKQIGAYADAEKAKDSVAIRPGKGKMRNRRYINRKGPLIVYGTEGSKVVKAFRNLPGVDVSNVERLNLLDLAPGGHLGRFVIWTECAFKKLDEVYGGFDTPSVKKKGFVLPRPKMANADLSRLINSDEVQSVVKPINKEVKRREARRNPLKNVAAVLKLNPYFGTARKMAALAEAARIKAKNEKLDSKRTKLSPEEASKIKAAGKAWYKTMISDSDYTEFDNFSKWLGTTHQTVTAADLLPCWISLLSSVLFFSIKNCCPCPSPRWSIPIGFEQPNWDKSESVLSRFPVSCSSIGKANRVACCRSGIMKLKNRAQEIFRDSDLVFPSGRKHGARNVQMDYGVRANRPTVVQTRCRWIIGDVTEVLDHNTWKLGKIARMLTNNYFVIRLADCIQLKEFHISSLRVPAPAAPHSRQLSVADKKSEAMNLKTKLARRGQVPYDAVPRRSNKKRKAREDTSVHPRKRTQPENATRACGLDGSSFQYRPPQFIREETDECSVASCSINDSENFANARERRRSVGFPDDAMSACPCTSGMDADAAADDEPAIGVHELELEAYQLTMRALYASGPLTWEQESLLTNLRLSLNISNDQHLRQLRHLLSSP